MNRGISIIIYFVFVVFTSGCSMEIQNPYSPSILLEGQGNVSTDKFRYLPSEREKDPLKENQVFTFSGLTPIYTEKPVNEVVENALLKELKFVGYKLEKSSEVSIGGDIIEFSCDYIGFANVDYKTKINFKVFKIHDGIKEEIYSKTHEGKLRADKSLGGPELIYGSLSKAIESFLVDAQKVGVL